MELLRRVATVTVLALSFVGGNASVASADPLNPNAWTLEATCTGLGDVTLTWLIGPTDSVRGSSAMQVVGSNIVVVIFTGGSEMIGIRDGTTCTFTSVNGEPFEPPLTFFVEIAPRTP